jgi:hypothetical protein
MSDGLQALAFPSRESKIATAGVSVSNLAEGAGGLIVARTI